MRRVCQLAGVLMREDAGKRLSLPGRRVLLLQNPGRGSRFYLEGLARGMRELGIGFSVLEMEEVWGMSRTQPAELVKRLSQILIQEKVGAVMGYGFNGIADAPADGGPLPGMRSFFEIRGVPQLMLWLDHPQWHANLVGLAPALQGMFRSGNCYHFFKSAAHALEMERMLGWPNCSELPAGVDAEQFPVRLAEKADFDVVTICTDGGELPLWLQDFVRLDEPDPKAIRQVILQQVRGALMRLWQAEAPEGMRSEMTALGEKWARLKAQQPELAAFRHWPALTEEFPGAAWYLTMAYPTYMRALRILWRLREWERRFYAAYLSRYFRVGVFGADWSAMGFGPGGGWVDYLQQSAVYGRGKVAMNICDGHDEEGLTMKPFEIAASGVAMLHYHAEGLEDCFQEDREVAVFATPREARERLDHLLDHEEERLAMAVRARERVLKQHLWRYRVVEMFKRARLEMGDFVKAKEMAALPVRV